MRRMLALVICAVVLFAGTVSAAEEKGKVTYIEGRAFIVRGMRTIPVKVGTELLAGDVVAVEEGSACSIDLINTGLLKISEKTKFEIPEQQAQQERTSSISLFFGGIWTEAKKLLQGESFEIKTPTATAGVRGTVFGTTFDEGSKSMGTVVESGHVVATDSSGNSVDLFQGMVGNASPSGIEAKVDPVAVAQASIKAAQVLDANTKEAQQKAVEKLKAKEAELKEAAARAEAQAKATAEANKKKAQEEENKKKAESEAAKKKAEAAKAEAEAAKKKAEEAKTSAEKAKAEAEAKAKAEQAAKAESEAKAKAAQAAAAAAEKAKVEAQSKAATEQAAKTKAAADAVAAQAQKASEAVQQKTVTESSSQTQKAPAVKEAEAKAKADAEAKEKADAAKAEAAKADAAKADAAKADAAKAAEAEAAKTAEAAKAADAAKAAQEQAAAPEQTAQQTTQKDALEELRKIEQEVQQQVEEVVRKEETQNPAIANREQITQVMARMQDRRDRLQVILTELQAIMNNSSLPTNQKFEQIQSKKAQAQQVQQEIAQQYQSDLAALQTLGATPETVSSASTFSPEAVTSLIETIQNIVLTVPVDIVFDTSIVPGLVNGKMRLPVQARGQKLEIFVDPKDAKNHQKVREIIEHELRLQAQALEAAEQERARLEQLRRLQESEARRQREGSLNPATATKDGSGIYLPVQLR